MKLFFAPGSCAIGIGALLEEAGATYDRQRLDLARGEQRDPAYLVVNPKGKVPALLLDDGTLVTEFQAIAYHIAASFPDARLLPTALEDRVKALSMLDYLVGTVHMRGFTLALVPMKFVSAPDCIAELRVHGTGIARAGLSWIAEHLGDKPFLLGDFSAVDAAAFYLIRWASVSDIGLPEELAGYYARLQMRPALRRALELEAQG